MSDKKTILVVDDEQDVITYLTTLFEDNGFATLVARNGDEAEQMARDNKPDLITLDITMPEESGLRAYRNLIEDEKTRAIPIIIVTGVSPEFERYVSRGRQFPAPVAYFEKPINKDELVAKVKEVLG